VIATESFYIIHHPCDYGRGNHYRGPFATEQAAEEATGEMPDPGRWYVVPAGDKDVLGTVGVDC
jgi:hypothetical protein